MTKFSFQHLPIWEEAIDIGIELFDVADNLELKRFPVFADQLRGTSMNISKKIAESTGTDQLREQKKLLDEAKRGCFEIVSMLFLLNKRDLVSKHQLENLSFKLDQHRNRIDHYSNSLW